MIILSVKDLKWVRADHQAFDASVETVELGVIPYTATPDSPTDYGKDIWSRGVDGEFGPIKAYVAPVLTPMDFPLTADRFYALLDNMGQLDQFIAAIETVLPSAKKLTCRNQFNNSQSFTWDMVLVTMVAPLIWGADWQAILTPAWIASGQA